MNDLELVFWFFAPWLALMAVLLTWYGVAEVWRHFGDWGVIMLWAWAEAELFVIGRHILKRRGR